MTNVAVIGAQWGDEGKGKVVDVLAEKFGCVVRFQGGNNAGHSVHFGGQQFALHLLPSGIFCNQTHNLIGNGVVVDPSALIREIDELKERGIEVTPDRLKISNRAHLVLPYHRIIDQFRDASPNQRKIGTTGKGIGPTYEWKAARRGIRFCDTHDKDDFSEKVRTELDLAQRLNLGIVELQQLHLDALMAEVWPAIHRLQDYVVDGVEFLAGLVEKNVPILFEGAQATLLDIDFGTYPYVTSSNSCALGIGAGAGVPARAIDRVVGITKAYATRVGEGPFPTELLDDVGSALRKHGKEFGTTTGRPRRCGWLDLVALRYAQRLNGFDCLALMKLDILDSFERLYVCEAYRIDGRETRVFPASLQQLQNAEPVYRELPGWNEDTSTIRQFGQLPTAAQDYVKAIESYVGCSVDLVSVGPDREETLLRSDGLFSDLYKR